MVLTLSADQMADDRAIILVEHLGDSEVRHNLVNTESL